MALDVWLHVRLNDPIGRKRTDRDCLYRRAAPPRLLGGRLIPPGTLRTTERISPKQRGGGDIACQSSVSREHVKAALRSSHDAWERIRCARSVLGRRCRSEKAADATAHLSVLHIMLVAGGRTVSVCIVPLGPKVLQVRHLLVFASPSSSEPRAGPSRTCFHPSASLVWVGKSAAPSQPRMIMPRDSCTGDAADQERRIAMYDMLGSFAST